MGLLLLVRDYNQQWHDRLHGYIDYWVTMEFLFWS